MQNKSLDSELLKWRIKVVILKRLGEFTKCQSPSTILEKDLQNQSLQLGNILTNFWSKIGSRLNWFKIGPKPDTTEVKEDLC